MFIVKSFSIMLLGAILFLGSVACQKEEGPAEEAGKKVDEAVEQLGEKVEETGDKVQDATQR